MDPVRQQEGILKAHSGMSLQAFEALMGDLSRPYSVQLLDTNPQFLGPHQQATTIAITPTEDPTIGFYVDKMDTVINGTPIGDPCYRLWAHCPNAWGDVVSSLLPPALERVSFQNTLHAVRFTAPALLLKAGPEVKKLYERFLAEIHSSR